MRKKFETFAGADENSAVSGNKCESVAIASEFKMCIERAKEELKRCRVAEYVSFRDYMRGPHTAKAMRNCELGHALHLYIAVINYYYNLYPEDMRPAAIRFWRKAWHALANDMQRHYNLPTFFKRIICCGISGASPPADARFPALRRAYLNLCRMEICSTQIFFHSTRL